MRISWFVLAVAACGPGTDFDDDERTKLNALTHLPEPSPDPSNEHEGKAGIVELGRALFFDPGLSGKATLLDGLRRDVTHARTAKDTPSGVSCSSCHDLSGGGADRSSLPNHVSVGTGWTPTNAGSVVNAVYYDLVFWNGRADSLWGMVVPVIENPSSMNGSRLATAWHVAEHYSSAYEAIFGELPFEETITAARAHAPTVMGVADPNLCKREAGVCPRTGCFERAGECLQRFPLAGKPGSLPVTRDPAVGVPPACQLGHAKEPFGDAFDCMESKLDQERVTRVAVNVGKALAAYQSKLVVRDSLFDDHMAERAEMSVAAIRGARLFVGKAACLECHSGAFFSDQQFHNIGVPQTGDAVPTEADCPKGDPNCDCVTPSSCQPWGAFDGRTKLQLSDLFRRDGKYSGGDADGPRSAHYTGGPPEELKGAWRTPTLRNVALTGPYMHNGVYSTLEEVVDHYDRGGSDGAASAHKSALMRPLGLTDQDKSDLVAFMKALSGPPLSVSLTTP